MKKIYLFSMLLLVTFTSFAQITATNYRGAFAPAPAAMWTDTWTEYDPQNKVYPTPTVIISDNITANATWTAGTTYSLGGQIYVKNNATLTIEPGVIIRSNVAGAALFITKGAKLMAEGTASSPIIFTSANDIGSRIKGDWGGIVLLGKGAYNINSGINAVEGVPVLVGNTDTEFGGGATPDDNDNSGILKYVRIEYAGYAYATNAEINGLTMGAVGRGTTIDYVQVSYANDDSFEWFGGAVNCSHLVAFSGLDDDFDTDNGFSGSVQFCLAIKDPAFADVSDSNCFESDNNKDSFDGTSFTRAIFSNCTLVGPTYRSILPNGLATQIRHRRGAHLRRNTQLQIHNSIFMDFVDGVVVDGATTQTNATNVTLKFKSNIIAGTAALKVATTTPAGFDVATWFSSNNNTSQTASAGLLTLAYNELNGSIYYTGLDYRPAASSIALTGADFTDASFIGKLQTTFYVDVDGDGYDSGSAVLAASTPPTGYSYSTLGSDCDDTNVAIHTNCPAITTVAYRGAFAPAPIPMWTDTWTEFDPQNKVYPTPTVTIVDPITVNTTWTAGNTYALGGQIYVKNNATLTIEPGVVIASNIAGAGLFITKGAKLIAEGTANSPIVFTSGNSIGNRARGNWGGVILLGKGSYNINGGFNYIEGIANSADTQFGGLTTPDDNDNSGTLKYVRIEYAGFTYGAAGSNTEINGLTMGAVGRGTKIDYVQVSYANDDSFEWFGGAVDCSHLVAFNGLDDDFDTDNGFSGNVQFCLGIKQPTAADTSDSNCFESDNSALSEAGTSFTRGIFSNCTLVGPTYRTTLPSGGSPLNIRHRRGAHLRRNTQLQIHNSIFMDFVDGVVVDGATTQTNATNNSLKFKSNIIAGTAALKVATTTPAGFDVATWFSSNNNTSQTASAGLLTLPYNELNGSIYYTGLDYRPAIGSIALTGADFTTLGTDNFIASSEFSLVVYPNPSANSFKLNYISSSDEKVKVEAYDLTGRLVDSRDIEYADINNQEIGNSYTAGVYIVVLKQGNINKSVKVIKN